MNRSLAKLEKSNENRQSLWLKVSSKEMPPGLKERFARLYQDVSHATVEADARGEACAELREEVLMLRARFSSQVKTVLAYTSCPPKKGVGRVITYR